MSFTGCHCRFELPRFPPALDGMGPLQSFIRPFGSRCLALLLNEASRILRGRWPVSHSAQGLVASVQRTRNRFSDIAADERFADHVGNPCGPRAFAQLRATVATHENNRNIWSQAADLTRQLGPHELGHRFVGQHEIEALWLPAKRPQ